MADSSIPPALEQPISLPVAAATNDVSPSVKVYVNNLPYEVTDIDLRAFAEELVTDIVSCQVETRETPKGIRSAGYGFVTFANPEAAQQAVTVLNGKDIQGRQIRVRLESDKEEARDRRGPRKPKFYYRYRRDYGRRGNRSTPREVTEADGAVASSEKPASSQEDKENRSESGQPAKFRKFRNKKKAAKAKASQVENGTSAEPRGEASGEGPGEAEKPKRARRIPRLRRAEGEEPQGVPSTTTLFVANLPFSLDDSGLAALFTEAGFVVNSARVVRRRWGQPRRSKGYGFVDVGNEDQQKRAMEALDSKELEGYRRIAVKIAVNPRRDTNGEEKIAEEAAEEAAAPEAVEELITVAQ